MPTQKSLEVYLHNMKQVNIFIEKKEATDNFVEFALSLLSKLSAIVIAHYLLQLLKTIWI